MSENLKAILVEAILAGFFAVAWMRAIVPAVPGGNLSFTDLLRFPGRIERLRRSRWQWFSMVAMLLVIRFQIGVPTVLEFIALLEFLIFLAVPTRVEGTGGTRRNANAFVVGSR